MHGLASGWDSLIFLEKYWNMRVEKEKNSLVMQSSWNMGGFSNNLSNLDPSCWNLKKRLYAQNKLLMVCENLWKYGNTDWNSAEMIIAGQISAYAVMPTLY